MTTSTHTQSGDFTNIAGEPFLAEVASSAELTLNSKGQVQFAVKFRYSTPDALLDHSQRDIKAFVEGLRITLQGLSLRLAGE